MDHFSELNAYRGLSPRQSRLLDLEAVVEGTAYDELEPWHARNEKGEPIECSKRKPDVLIGVAAEKVAKLVRRLSGSGSRPQLEGVESIKSQLEQIRIEPTLPLAAQDLVVKGSCALGFARLADGRFEPVYIEPEWAEPIFVARAAGERARQVAEEMELLGVPMPTPARGQFLLAPPEADSHDVVFLRHEWVVDEEVAEVASGTPRTTQRWRYRRDYLPHVILEYKPLKISADDQYAKLWELSEPPRPHNWGVVPIVWARSPKAKPGQFDGPSFLSPPVLSLDRAADYLESMGNDAVKKIAWPQLALIDLQDRVDMTNRELGQLGESRMSSSSGYVLDLQTTSIGGHQGKVQILEIRGDGPKVAAEQVERFKTRVGELTGLVDFDQSQAAGALSGVALERMLEPMISTVEEWRGPVEALLIALCQKLAKVVGKTVKPVVRWPRIVDVTPADLVAAAQALSTATGGQPVMSRETAVRLFARLADLPDVEEELKRLEADAEEELARAREALSAQESGTGPTEA